MKPVTLVPWQWRSLKKPMEQAPTNSPTQGFQLHSLQTTHVDLCSDIHT